MPKKKGPEAKHQSGWVILKDRDKQIEDFCRDYLTFMSRVKTEREAVAYIMGLSARGLIRIENRGKALALCRKGTRPLADGVRIVVAHLDSPRLDLKANPLYEDTELAMLKTHYYGGIKKYQWLARPLALHGVVVREDGSSVTITIGEEADEPCFTIEDLLPHLAGKVHAEKRVSEAFQGEKLNIIFGSRPDLEVKEEKVKAAVLKLLKSKYGMVEQDFVSADIEIVPSGAAREVGLDRSLIGAYGQDDRVCAWTAYAAVRDAKNPPYTTIALLVDKEEIGSEGNTGAKSIFLEEVLWQLAQSFKQQIIPAACFTAARPSPATSTAPWTRIIPRCTKRPMPPAWVTASA